MSATSSFYFSPRLPSFAFRILLEHLRELRILSGNVLQDGLNQCRVLSQQLTEVLNLGLVGDGFHVECTTGADGDHDWGVAPS